jgi:hypothetical protein
MFWNCSWHLPHRSRGRTKARSKRCNDYVVTLSSILYFEIAIMAELTNGTGDERTKNRNRFELELEFVQALANPFYLHSLAQQGILYQPAFINYLKYLQYWKEKDYARFIL